MHTVSSPALPSSVVAVSGKIQEQLAALVNLAVDRLEAGVHDNASCENARLHLSALQAVKKKVDKDRLAASKPFRDIVDEINTIGAVVMESVEPVQEELKIAIGAYLHKREVEEAKALTAAIQAAGDTPQDGRVTPAIPILPPPTAPPKVSTYVHTEVTVTAQHLLPAEFLIPDMVKIRASVKAGVTPPGVTVTTETRVAAR